MSIFDKQLNAMRSEGLTPTEQIVNMHSLAELQTYLEATAARLPDAGGERMRFLHSLVKRLVQNPTSLTIEERDQLKNNHPGMTPTIIRLLERKILEYTGTTKEHEFRHGESVSLLDDGVLESGYVVTTIHRKDAPPLHPRTVEIIQKSSFDDVSAHPMTAKIVSTAKLIPQFDPSSLP